MTDIEITQTSEAIPLLWWDYPQNNSGGSFYGPQYVFVQATSAEEANSLAEASGLVYFDGRDDCDCCGARWDEQWQDERGTADITLYGDPVSDWRDPSSAYSFRWDGLQSARVLYDGSIENGIVLDSSAGRIGR